MHKCGGQARCTTCRVQFVAGEPDKCTAAEVSVLRARALVNTPGLRLSCQLQCDGEMTVKAISRLTGSGLTDPGKRPADLIEPPAMWLGGKPSA